MNLWILSQNKDLLEKAEKVKVVYMDDYDEYGEPVMVRLEDRVFENHKKTYGIVVNDAYVFGEYKTRKRALEVLAEITKMLQINTITNGSYQELDLLTKLNILCNMSKTYIMPSE